MYYLHDIIIIVRHLLPGSSILRIRSCKAFDCKGILELRCKHLYCNHSNHCEMNPSFCAITEKGTFFFSLVQLFSIWTEFFSFSWFGLLWKIQIQHTLVLSFFGTGCDFSFLSLLHSPESWFFTLGLQFPCFFVWSKPNCVIYKLVVTIRCSK